MQTLEKIAASQVLTPNKLSSFANHVERYYGKVFLGEYMVDEF